MRLLYVLLLLCTLRSVIASRRSTAVYSVLVAVAAYSCYWRKKALLLHQRNTMNANTIKAAAKPLGMLAVRCPAPCVLFEYAAH